MITTEDYFSANRLSNSDLSLLKKNPLLLKKKLEGKDMGTTPQLELGTATHLFILEPEKYKSDVRVFKGKMPANPQQRKFGDLLKKGMEYNDAYKECYATKGKSDKAVMEAAQLLRDDLWSYIETYDPSKINISLDDYSTLERIKSSVYGHKRAVELLNADGFVETSIFWEFKGVNMKSKLDKFIIYKDYNHVILIDFKTTDNINTFANSFRKYDYARQLGCYTLALTHEYDRGDIFKGMDTLNFEWKIIATETSGLYTTKCFNIIENIVQEGVNQFDDLVNRYKLHLEYGFDHTVEYYEGNGDEDLVVNVYEQ